MSAMGSTLNLVSAATKAGITPEDMLENCRNNDVPCYVLTNIKVRRYSFICSEDKHFFFPQGFQRRQEKENFQINTFYRLSGSDIDLILYSKDRTATIQAFIVKNFSKEKMPPKLIESINEAPNIVADEPQTYGIGNLVLTHDGYAKLNTDEVFLIDITDYEKELKAAIKIYRTYWENLPDNMQWPTEDAHLDDVCKAYGLDKKSAKIAWDPCKTPEARPGGNQKLKGTIPYRIGPHPKKQ